MVFNTRTAAVLLLGSIVLTGCATRGALRTAVEEQQAALEAERAERIAADERLASDLASLRSDLEALRREFSAEIEAVAQGLQFALPVHFAFDDATVRFEDHEALERFTRIVNRHYPGSLVTVEGFADPAGTAAYNRALSQRRAEAVRDHLVDAQIRAQVRAVGYGQDRLVVPGAAKDDPGAQLNRRVVFVIESPPRLEALATAPRLEG
jgi:peptidoglycan-associated lipoprotein